MAACPSTNGKIAIGTIWVSEDKEMPECDDFEALMIGEFEMSAMDELTFFLGLQVKQKPDGIFISQEKSMIGSLMYLTV
ncbi:hypothetical protein Tco_1561880 [Tanacetum coccineum]